MVSSLPNLSSHPVNSLKILKEWLCPWPSPQTPHCFRAGWSSSFCSLRPRYSRFGQLIQTSLHSLLEPCGQVLPEQQPRDPAVSRWGSLRTHLFSPALFAVRTSEEESWGGENPSLSSSFLWDFSTGPYLCSWVCGRGWAVERRIRCPSPSPLLVTLATPLRLSALGGLMLPTWRVVGGLRPCGSAQQTARPSGSVQDRERTSPFRDPRNVQGSLSPLPAASARAWTLAGPRQGCAPRVGRDLHV